MSIGVYRLYMGRTWAHSIAQPALLRGLDLVPGFFYRLDRISEIDIAAAERGGASLKNLVRIAMTHSHVVLVDADRGNLVSDVTPIEVALAQSGFRSRIPVLAITRRPEQALDALAIEHADRVVAFDIGDIICAIQELVEGAAAERRHNNERLLTSIGDALRKSGVVQCTPHPVPQSTTRERAAPIDEIAQAFATFVAQRSQTSPN